MWMSVSVLRSCLLTLTLTTLPTATVRKKPYQKVAQMEISVGEIAPSAYEGNSNEAFNGQIDPISSKLSRTIKQSDSPFSYWTSRL